MLIEKTGLSDYIKNYPLLKNSKEFDIASLSIRSIFEDNLSLSSSSPSLSYDFFSLGITFDDFPDTVLNSEEIAFLMFIKKNHDNHALYS